MTRRKKSAPPTPRQEAAEALYALAKSLMYDGQSLARHAMRMAAGDADMTLRQLRRYVNADQHDAPTVRKVIAAYETATMTPAAIAEHRRGVAQRKKERREFPQKCAEAQAEWRHRQAEQDRRSPELGGNVVSLFGGRAGEDDGPRAA